MIGQAEVVADVASVDGLSAFADIRKTPIMRFRQWPLRREPYEGSRLVAVTCLSHIGVPCDFDPHWHLCPDDALDHLGRFAFAFALFIERCSPIEMKRLAVSRFLRLPTVLMGRRRTEGPVFANPIVQDFGPKRLSA